MTLTANREVDHYVDQELRSYPLGEGEHVFKGAFVGLRSDGCVRPLAAGDRCVGLAYEEGDNTSGVAGDFNIRVFTLGDFGFSLMGAAPADIGRPVYAADDETPGFEPGGRSFVGYVQDCPAPGEIVLRLATTGPLGANRIDHHTASFNVTRADSGTVHTNLGAVGPITASLPQNPPTGTELKFVCMADQELRLAPGFAGGIYIKGAKQADNKYVAITDIGDFVHLVADGNGDWVAVGSISGADADIIVQA